MSSSRLAVRIIFSHLTEQRPAGSSNSQDRLSAIAVFTRHRFASTHRPDGCRYERPLPLQVPDLGADSRTSSIARTAASSMPCPRLPRIDASSPRLRSSQRCHTPSGSSSWYPRMQQCGPAGTLNSKYQPKVLLARLVIRLDASFTKPGDHPLREVVAEAALVDEVVAGLGRVEGRGPECRFLAHMELTDGSCSTPGHLRGQWRTTQRREPAPKSHRRHGRLDRT